MPSFTQSFSLAAVVAPVQVTGIQGQSPGVGQLTVSWTRDPNDTRIDTTYFVFWTLSPTGSPDELGNSSFTLGGQVVNAGTITFGVP